MVWRSIRCSTQAQEAKGGSVWRRQSTRDLSIAHSSSARRSMFVFDRFTRNISVPSGSGSFWWHHSAPFTSRHHFTRQGRSRITTRSNLELRVVGSVLATTLAEKALVSRVSGRGDRSDVDRVIDSTAKHLREHRQLSPRAHHALPRVCRAQRLIKLMPRLAAPCILPGPLRSDTPPALLFQGIGRVPTHSAIERHLHPSYGPHGWCRLRVRR